MTIRSWFSFSRLSARAIASETSAGEAPAVERPRDAVASVELERAASRELLELDRHVRVLHDALARGGGAVKELLTPDARLDLTGCRWARAEAFVGGSASDPAVRFAERSRTVHVVADTAIVLSVCDVSEGKQSCTAVLCVQLRRAGTSWLVRDLVSREDVYAFSERISDPRPLAARDRSRRARST